MILLQRALLVVGHDKEGLFVLFCLTCREASDNIGVIELLSEANLLKKSGQPFWPEVIRDLNDTAGVASGLGVINQVRLRLSTGRQSAWIYPTYSKIRH